MEKYVFYEAIDHCWFIPKDKWAEYEYNEEVKPIRMTLLECSEEYCKMLIDLLLTYPDTFEDMIKEELDNSLPLYSN